MTIPSLRQNGKEKVTNTNLAPRPIVAHSMQQLSSSIASLKHDMHCRCIVLLQHELSI